MSGSVLNRLVWKEYRLLRGFWWAMLIAALLGQLYALWIAERTDDAHWIFLVGLALTACYALGCGATAFAGERESGTYALQRVMPVTPPELLLGKLLYAALSTLALGVLAWLIAMLLVYARKVLGNGTFITGSYTELAVLGAFKSIELLVWGVFFSLLLAKPLRAIAFAALATAAVSYPLSWLLSDIPARARTAFYFPSFLGDSATLIPRAIIVILVVGCDIYLVRRWFSESTGGSADHTVGEARRRELARKLSAHLQTNPQRQRLLWQTLVRSRWMLMACVLTYLCLFVANISVWETLKPAALIGMLIPVAGLMGVFAFADDQLRCQFRFFAEHGVSSRQVWWSRQLFWIGLLLLSLFIATVAETAAHGKPFGWVGWSRLGMLCGMAFLVLAVNHRCASWLRIGMGIVLLSLLILTVSEIHLHGINTAPWRNGGLVGSLWIMAIMVYAVGQLCSQWIRSTIMAGAVTLIVATLLAAWSYITFRFRVSTWGAVVPIPIALLLASWVTTDEWLKERTRSRMRKVALLAIPALCILAFVGFFRGLQIPAVTPQFHVTELTVAERKEGEETAEMYDKLDHEASFKTSDEEAGYETPFGVRDLRDWKSPHELYSDYITANNHQWLDKHADVVRRAVDMSQRENAFCPKDSSYYWITPTRALVTLEARRQQQDGNLDRALELYLAALRIGRHESQWDSRGYPQYSLGGESNLLHYLRYWAAEPGQTPGRIRRALDGLEQIWAMPLDPEIGIANNYEQGMKTLSDVAAGRSITDWSARYRNNHDFYRWCYRLMPWELSRAERLVGVCAQRTLDSLNVWRNSLRDHTPPKLHGWRNLHLDSWMRTTPMPVMGWARYFPIGSLLAHTAAIRRGTQQVLALRGWQLEHGQLPDSLDQLVPTWFAQLPLDPMTLQPFDYYPQGQDTPLDMDNYGGLMYFGLPLPRHTPYLTVRDPMRRNARHLIVFLIEDPATLHSVETEEGPDNE